MADVFRQYSADSLYFTAFVISLGLLWWKECRTRQGKIGKKAVTAFLLSIVFVFNEVAYQIVGKVTDATSYYRFFWMLPILFLIAYQFTEKFLNGRNDDKFMAAFLFVICLSVGSNFFFIDREHIHRPKNI